VSEHDYSGPRPFVHGEEAVYFDYCQQGELRIQRCADCGRFVFYPRYVCPDCLGSALEWVRAAGTGTVHTFTVQHRAAPGFSGPLPYVIAVVELDEGVRMLSRITGDPDRVRIGLPVAVAWARIDDDFQVPVFVPRDEAAA
jgi:uncharacterized OB-fold protein